MSKISGAHSGVNPGAASTSCLRTIAFGEYGAVATGFGGPGFLLPTRNHEVFTWCLKGGLRVVYQMTLMTTGLYHEPDGAYLPSVLY